MPESRISSTTNLLYKMAKMNCSNRDPVMTPIVLPTDLAICGHTYCQSELSIDPDMRLFEGSKLEPELEESDESKEEGAFEVVM